MVRLLSEGLPNKMGGLNFDALQAGLGLCLPCVSTGDHPVVAVQPLHVLSLPHRVGMSCVCRPEEVCLVPRLAWALHAVPQLSTSGLTRSPPCRGTAGGSSHRRPPQAVWLPGASLLKRVPPTHHLAPRQHPPPAWPLLQEASGGDLDLLPGICALAQQWLGDVALPGFRGMPPTAPSLNAWFTSRRVVDQLKVREGATFRDGARAVAWDTWSAGALSGSSQGLVPCQGLCRVRCTCERVPPVEVHVPVDSLCRYWVVDGTGLHGPFVGASLVCSVLVAPR